MAPATENAVLPLKPDVDLTTGPAAETWRSTLSTIGAQPGCQRIVWGRSIENPENAQMLIGTAARAPPRPLPPNPAPSSTAPR